MEIEKQKEIIELVKEELKKRGYHKYQLEHLDETILLTLSALESVEKSEETENIYDLYEPKNQTERDYLTKATKEITNAINSKIWDNVEYLQTKYKEIGANDTASNDEIIDVWKKKYGESPPGWN